MITYYLKKIYSNYGFIFIVLGMLHFEVRVSLCVVAWVGTITEKKQLMKYFHTTEMDTLMRTVTYAYKYTCIFTK